MEQHYANETHQVLSKFLKKQKRIDVFLPPDYDANTNKTHNLVVMNDGQDAKALHIRPTLDKLHQENLIESTILVAVHASGRLHEYGTAGHPDYANRGDQAKAYTSFVLYELMPFLNHRYKIDRKPEAKAMLGCSLGGLSAFDIAWNHPNIFARVGVCSGSFWWRRHSANDDQAQIDRIIHSIVRHSNKKEGMKFWFQAGTHDETSDRNNNGIIDAIEDTLDLIAELVFKGYDNKTDIRYLEVEGGEHNQKTWAVVIPDFLMWTFGKDKNT